MPDAPPDRGLLESIKALLDAVGSWLEEHLGGSDESKRVLAELGLPPGTPPTQEQRARLAASRQKTEAVLDDVIVLGDTLVAICRGFQGGHLSDRDAFYVIASVVAAEQFDRRLPRFAAVGRALGVIVDDPEEIRQLAFPRLFSALSGDAERPDGTVADWVMPLGILLPLLVEKPAQKAGLVLEGYYGWDPEPASATPEADLASSRALTLLLRTDTDVSPGVALTLVPIPPAHGGALLLSIGGAITIDSAFDSGTLRAQVAAAGGLQTIVPPLESAGFQVGGDLDATVNLRWSSDDMAPWRIGSKGGTRLELERSSIEAELSRERGRLRLGIDEGKLVLAFQDADGLLRNLAGGEVRAPFSLALVMDSATGVHLEGGTRFTVRIPTGVAILPGCTLQYLELSVGSGRWPRSIEMSLAAGLTFPLGAFVATIDRVGFSLALALLEGGEAEIPAHRIGPLGYQVGFLAPRGLGLSLDCGPIKGGGYLWFDPDAGEYAGVLELKLETVQLKALAVISTSVPVDGGRTTWSVLVLMFAEWEKGYPLPGSLFLDGVGGMLGVNHRADIPALEAGLRDRVLDDLVFPADPVADAPRIIPRLRGVFPPSVESVTVGPFFKIGYMKPRIATARLGIVAQLDNVAPGGAPFTVTRVLLFGTVAVTKPEPPHKAHVDLKADILGYIDFAERRLSFFAQLRDSKIGGITLTGSFLLRIDWGASRAFLMAFGGFHPDYKDLPPGLPAPIHRLGVAPIKRGGFTIEANGYLAVTSNSLQVGFGGSAKAKLGPVGLEGKLRVDGLFTGDGFLLACHIVARVTYKGRSLAGVDIDAKLRGPGYWRLWGKVTFEILWWDVSRSFDVDWGDADAPAPVRSTAVAQLIEAALVEQGNWKAALPAGSDGLVTLAAMPAGDGVAAHPLAAVEFSQNVAPFNLTLERFGETAVQGARRFDVGQLRIGSRTLEQPALVTGSFARGHFLDLSDAQKLSSPSFEPMPAGVEVGSPEFTAGPAVGGDLDYETFYLDPVSGPNPPLPRGRLRREPGALGPLSPAALGWQAAVGAVARSRLRRAVAGPAAPKTRLTVAPPPLVVLEADTLKPPPQPVALDGGASRATALALQMVGARSDRATLRVVESHERE